ncbi:hypothetical protein ACFB49_22170 [Sphingomonas sp. DBB INV C78]
MHGGRYYQDMAGTRAPPGTSKQHDELISRCLAAGAWAGVAATAAAVNFARRDTFQSDLWPFRAPDRTVAVPDACRRAVEAGARGHDGKKQ